MKKIFIVFVCLFISGTISSQNLQWAKSLTTLGSLSTDSAGNLYSVGNFTGTVDVNPGSGDSSLLSAGGQDIYIFKLDPLGNFIWGRKIGSGQTETYYSAVSDNKGNIYIAGRFQFTVDFDPGPDTFNITSGGFYDMFVVKLNTSGNFEWAKSFSGISGSEEVRSIAVDDSGNVCTTGNFVFDVDFDPGPGTFFLTASAGNPDVFVSKLNKNGDFVWAKKMGGTSSEFGQSIRLDHLGNVYSSGTFLGTIDFDPGAGNYFLTGGGSVYHVYISKLDNNGNFLWAKKIGGTSNDLAFIGSLYVDNFSNVYLAGGVNGGPAVDFDPGPGIFNLSGKTYILKLNQSGNFVWANTKTSNSTLGAYGLIVDAYQNVYNSGYFTDSVDVDPGSNSTYLTSSGGQDGFVSKLDSSGNFDWAFRLGSPTSSDFIGVAFIDAYNSLYTAGTFSGTIDFDPGIGVYNLTGNNNRFIQKLNQCTNCAKPTAISLSNISATSVSVNWTGNECASKYRIQYRMQGTTAWTTIKLNAPSASKLIGSLSCNTIYEIRVRSECNNTGTFVSSYSTIQTFSTLCQTPTNISSTNLNPTSVEISWNGVLCATKYTLQYRILGTTSWTSITIISPTTSKTISGLSANTTYQYRLRTICVTGSVFSNYSGIKTFTTPLRLGNYDDDSSAKFILYPNPCNDKIIIKHSEQIVEPVHLEIITLDGKLIFQMDCIIESETEIDINKFPTGMYLLTLKTSNYSINKKLIKI